MGGSHSIMKKTNISNKLLSSLSTLPLAIEFSTLIENLSGNGKFPFSVLSDVSCLLFIVEVTVAVHV